MEARFKAKKKDILERLSVPDGDYTDASPKGSVDEPIRELVKEINSTPGYVTTSSCSGRLAVYLEGPSRVSATSAPPNGDTAIPDETLPVVSTSAGGKGGGKWLFTSHGPVDLQYLGQDGAISSLLGLEPAKELSFPTEDETVRQVHLKFEPMILHILTCSMQQAQVALTAATAAGFRESGISGLTDTKGRPTPPMVAVRSSGLAFDSIIGSLSEGQILPMVSEAYLSHQLRWANRHFKLNEERKVRFRQQFFSATASGSKQQDMSHTDQRKSKPISEKQRRKEDRKQALRASFAEAAERTVSVDVCEPPDFDEGPESDVRILIGEESS